ncbi:MAG: ATP-dependent Clp protease proteolytic subunit [Bacteroidales bacterium]|nr:ATP-dependent Clp protease proteolytic subunit [Bacteroidales bacterium]
MELIKKESIVENEKKAVKIIKPPVLYKQTQQLIKKIEKSEQVKVLSYWNSVNGSICQNDVSALFEIIKDWEVQDKIYLFIKSDGGDGKASLRIINLLRQHTHKLIGVIQGECASAATMLALGADEILMGPLAFLSAVDTSITHDLSPVDKNNSLVSVSQDELSRVLNLWNRENGQTNPYHDLYQYIHPLVFGAVDRAGSLSIKLCSDILSYHMVDAEKASEISRHLNSDYPSHGYPITLREAQRIGLNARQLDKDLNDLFSELNSLYSQMGQRAYTDYDENNYHNNEIINILEADGMQVYFQNDKDWHYRNEERRYIPMNDNSSWYKVTGTGAKSTAKTFQIR